MRQGVPPGSVSNQFPTAIPIGVATTVPSNPTRKAGTTIRGQPQDPAIAAAVEGPPTVTLIVKRRGSSRMRKTLPAINAQKTFAKATTAQNGKRIGAVERTAKKSAGRPRVKR